MNRVHNVLCSSGWWSRRVERELVPWGLAGVELGEDVLEIGPGFGATTRVLAERLDLLRAIHVGDTLNLIDPDGLPPRLEAAGLAVREVARRRVVSLARDEALGLWR